MFDNADAIGHVAEPATPLVLAYLFEPGGAYLFGQGERYPALVSRCFRGAMKRFRRELNRGGWLTLRARNHVHG